MGITLRSTKGTFLSHNEVDTNFSELYHSSSLVNHVVTFFSDGSGSFQTISHSMEINTGSTLPLITNTDTTATVAGNLVVTGNLTAEQFFTEITSASIIYASGSTKSGDTQDDNHAFTGSVQVSGSLTVSQNGNVVPFYYANQGAFPSATTYHGAVAHSHADGAMYYAHGGGWTKLATDHEVLSNDYTGSFVLTSSFQPVLDNTGSYATTSSVQNITNLTGSYATTSSVQNITNLTGSYAVTGSNIFSGSQVITGSLVLTGSADITGSLFVSGAFSGSSIYVGGGITAGDDITAFYSSDQNLKDNIELIPNAVEKVKQIKGVSFDWNDRSKHRGHDVGVIAQDIEKVLPELVVTRDNGFKAVKYDRLVALLIQANKELIERIEKLENK